MKNIKKLTYAIKIRLPEDFNIKEWGIKSEDATCWVIVNRKTGEIKVIDK